MKKMQKKLSLSRETLRRLDDSNLADAAGGRPILPSKTTADPTQCTLCYICEAAPVANPIAQPLQPVLAG